MMMAETEGRPKVTGIRMAIVPAEPIPGSTPIMVPIKTPMKQYNRFIG
jgi:hypothetical protein